MNELVQGNLDCCIEYEFEGEFKEFGMLINCFIDDMCCIIGFISDVMICLFGGDLMVEFDEQFEGEF